MSINHTIREAVLSGKSADIRKLLLTPEQINLVKFVEMKGSVTSHFVKGLLDISSQNASAKLRRLHDAGYLRMIERNAESGGIERVYYNREILRV